MHSAAGEDERPANRAKVSCGSEDSNGTTSSAAYSALLVERDEFKSCLKALMLENQCVLRIAEEAGKLCAKVANIKNSNVSKKRTPTRGQRKSLPLSPKS